MTQQLQYPNVYNLLNNGDEGVTMQDIINDMLSAGLTEADLPVMEAAILETPRILQGGVPFPGDEPEFDDLVAKSTGLQLIQKFYDAWG